ncbi:transporter substrate-binding domain-containing protein [Duganella ginsengisoli]|uniref:Transporter substrate-binding domain-containing protein n=2 Tax=Pseudoduganella ginsengisoli TaxID=1462440 RepID=A0A6L6Q3Y4_9BURK|nr:transporter substrate-binding domain-containing protein [Pseudoduganella ginsengisoli]
MGASAPATADRVTVYTNATFAPLFIDQKTGLYPEMVAYLNQLKLDGIDFALETMPRKRLQAQLDNGTLDGIVIGMAPQWVGDAAQEKFLWTEPFAHDAFVLVSRDTNPFFFGQPSQAGARIGVTLGYVYPGVDEWIAQNQFVRDDAATEERNLDKLLRGRVDMIVVTDSVFRYYMRTHRFTGGVISEALPGTASDRRILVPKSQRGLYDKLAPAIRKLAEDPRWKMIQSRY